VAAVPTYAVERDLPRVTLDQLVAAQRATIVAAEQLTSAGKAVRYLRCVFVPAAAHCLCLFEADCAQYVQDVNEAAHVPFTCIAEAVEFVTEGC
jgi:hypothetical protein